MVAVRKFAGTAADADEKEALAAALGIAGVESEADLFQNPQFQKVLKQFAPRCSDKEWLKTLFKPFGPIDAIEPISNQNEADVLDQWQNVAGRCKFCPIPFQLIDFASDPHSVLNNFNWLDRLKQGYRTFAVFINTINRKQLKQCKEGESCGLHWMTVFFDFRPLDNCGNDGPVDWKRMETAPYPFTKACTVEFFNSSGNAPVSALRLYFKQLQLSFASNLPGINLWVVNASLFQQQFDESSCGIYCLYYIYHRLKSVPYTWFLITHVTTEEIHWFRRFVFLPEPSKS